MGGSLRRRAARSAVLFIGALIAGGALWLPLSAGSPAFPFRCGPSEATTLARSAKLRVYELPEDERDPVYACGPALQKPQRIGPEPRTKRVWFDHLLKPVLIRGYWVGAAESRTEGIDFGSTWVRAVQVASGRQALCELGRWGNLGGTRVKLLLLSPNGVLVWAAHGVPNPRLGLCQGKSTLTILDEDAGLDYSSITLKDGVLRWSDSTGEHRRRIG